METLEQNKTLLESAYLTKGTIGNLEMPGAPIAHFSLVVNSSTGTVSGIDVVSFSILNDGGTYLVMAQSVSFGGV